MNRSADSSLADGSIAGDLTKGLTVLVAGCIALLFLVSLFIPTRN